MRLQWILWFHYRERIRNATRLADSKFDTTGNTTIWRGTSSSRCRKRYRKRCDRRADHSRIIVEGLRLDTDRIFNIKRLQWGRKEANEYRITGTLQLGFLENNLIKSRSCSRTHPSCSATRSPPGWIALVLSRSFKH
jgi:hypothetical protein